ncbi:MAG: imidazole glycerol phosphate synthase subunit HisH [bacterium]
MIAIIDYGLSNMKSIENVLSFLSLDYEVINTATDMTKYSHVILPGVGAFIDGMKGLKERGLDIVLKDLANKGVPILGICLGMQLLLDKSLEFGETKGLSLFSGVVKPLKFEKKDNMYDKKVPHIGWNRLLKNRVEWEGNILDNLVGDEVYFVHSFFCDLYNQNQVIANTSYHNHMFASVIRNKNVYGCQFHPEKSAKVGIQIVENFIKFGEKNE